MRNGEEDVPGFCPECGGESDGNVYHTCPPLARCSECGYFWEFGTGIKICSIEEGKKLCPELYKDFENEN